MNLSLQYFPRSGAGFVLIEGQQQYPEIAVELKLMIVVARSKIEGTENRMVRNQMGSHGGMPNLRIKILVIGQEHHRRCEGASVNRVE